MFNEQFQINSKQSAQSWFNRLLLDTWKAMYSEFNCGETSGLARKDEPESTEPESLAIDGTIDGNHQQHQEDQQNTNQSTVDTRDNGHGKTRPYDVIIFGATGSVGKFVAEEMALVVDKYYSNGNNQHHQQQTSGVATSTMVGTIKELRSPNQFAQNSNSRRSSVPRPLNDIRWAVAGRSALRLSETLGQAELSTGIRSLSNRIPVVLADLNHHRSLLEMCLKTSLIINCVGPYSMDGETLIKACLETKTNYLDLSFETTFVERMRQLYSSRAERAGIYIINGCGFQSMACEMGLNFLKQITDGQIERVKIILSLSNPKATMRPTGGGGGGDSGGQGEVPVEHEGIVSRGMWNSWLIERAVEISIDERMAGRQQAALAQARSPRPSTSRGVSEAIYEQEDEDHEDDYDERQHQNPQKPLLRMDTQSLVRDMVEFQNRKSIDWFGMLLGSKDETGKGYCLPTNGFTSEESQLIRGEMAHYEHRKPDLESNEGWRPIRCTSFLSLKSFGEVLVLLLWFLIFNMFVKFSLFRKAMRTFPVVASLGNVTSSGRKFDRDNLSHIKFCQTFVAYGTPGDDSGDPLEEREKHLKRKQEELLVARVVGPEPNHVATATYAVQAALTLIAERDHLPIGGGVLTPGAAFAETNIIYQLRRRNIKFEVLKKAQGQPSKT